MIGYLEGNIISKKPTEILLNVNGVGYLVHISVNTFENLPAEKQKVSLFTHLSVREVSMDLFGFLTASEKEMFELLISINGVGPKLALSILSGITVPELKDAIRNNDLSRIISVPGIGRKTGQRLLIELKDKIESASEEIGVDISTASSVKTDAVSALTSLGYNQKTAEKAIANILGTEPEISIEKLIKDALVKLSK